MRQAFVTLAALLLFAACAHGSAPAKASDTCQEKDGAKSCQAGCGKACGPAGDALMNQSMENGDPELADQARRLYQRGCEELHDAASCRREGRLLHDGNAAFEPDVPRGYEILRMACEKLQDKAACADITELKCVDEGRSDCAPAGE
jgi:hypothetical protein